MRQTENTAIVLRYANYRDYDRMLRTIAQFEERGMSRDEAEVEAFYAITRGGEQ